MNKFEEVKKLKDELRAKIAAIGKKGIRDFFAPIFAANPDLNAIKWNQYTPYFNDGDACVFGVNEPYVKFKGDDESGNYEDGWLTEYEFKHYKEESAERKAKVDALPKIDWDFRLPDEDVLQEIFGDHTQITVFRNGTIEQEDYEHD